jgi:hypothetical protein
MCVSGFQNNPKILIDGKMNAPKNDCNFWNGNIFFAKYKTHLIRYTCIVKEITLVS